MKAFEELVPKLTEAEIVKLAGRKYKEDDLIPAPLEIDLTQALKLITKKKFDEAKKLFLEGRPFLGISGRLGEAKENLLAIERFLADTELKEEKIKKNKDAKKIAIVGGGPTGMTASYYLAKKGHEVTIFEAMDKLGGFLRYKVPEFRLPKKIMDKEEKRLKQFVKIKYNTVIGSGLPLEDLAKKFNAVGITTGANKPCFMGIPGEHLGEVYTSSEFLYDLPASGKQEILVIGGGKSAIDCARTAIRLGNKVTIVYRRGFNDFIVDEDQIKAAQEEGVKFLLLTQPLEILGEDNVTGLKCEQMMNSYVDDDGRNHVSPIEESEFEIPCDRIICACGHEPNPVLGKNSSLRIIGKYRPWVDEHRQTSIEKVFAAGMLLKPKLNFEGNLYEGWELANTIDLFVKGKFSEEDGEPE